MACRRQQPVDAAPPARRLAAVRAAARRRHARRYKRRALAARAAGLGGVEWPILAAADAEADEGGLGIGGGGGTGTRGGASTPAPYRTDLKCVCPCRWGALERCCGWVRLHWRRLRSAPSVYVASSAALLRLLQALLFAAAPLLALVALPLDPGCMGDAPLATMARPAGAAAVAVGVAPALLALALLADIVPHYGVVADVGLAVNAEVLERLKGGQSLDDALVVEEGRASRAGEAR